jgi:hypothetical protein
MDPRAGLGDMQKLQFLTLPFYMIRNYKTEVEVRHGLYSPRIILLLLKVSLAFNHYARSHGEVA